MRAVSVLTVTLILISSGFADTPSLDLTLRYQRETAAGSGRFHRLTRSEQWKPAETAIIVCDVWDLHHCYRAVQRLEELVPRLNQVLHAARRLGITVIHAPSDCMDAYADHPARQRARQAPQADFVPRDIDQWCSVLPAERRFVYPIDQSDGGEDDTEEEHARWVEHLRRLGRRPEAPWKAQHSGIEIDAARDFLSDRGSEIWNVLQAGGIRNVILTGVHTNMCVLGRPFGLRQMARNGMNVVLMRDLTDTMYNPQQWPFVSHFTGTDLIVSHIERCVCPTITSDQLLGGTPFRFSDDRRPHLVMLLAEDEYHTVRTLPEFAMSHLGRDFRVSTVFADSRNRNDLPGIDVVDEADVLLISVRRRVLPPEQLQRIRSHVAAGRPVVGIRTASHAFCLRSQDPPEGHDAWPEFDAQVFGGSYHGHHDNDLQAIVRITDSGHPVTSGLSPQEIPMGGSLYLTSPLADGTQVLTIGVAEGQPPEPVSWTFQRKDGGRSFYTSMGHEDDFRQDRFRELLYRGICWAAGITPVDVADRGTRPAKTAVSSTDHWMRQPVPSSANIRPAASADADPETRLWLRCAVRLPRKECVSAEGTLPELQVPCGSRDMSAWMDGTGLNRLPQTSPGICQFQMLQPQTADVCLLVLCGPAGWLTPRTQPPVVRCGTTELSLEGFWQSRTGSGDRFSSMPLPAKFGICPEIVFEPEEPLWTARALTMPGAFTPGIEGPACDRNGHLFAVNFDRQGTIGRVTPDGSAEIFVHLPAGSTGNGIRFAPDGTFFVADYTGHQVLQVDPNTRRVSVLARNDQMNQPNDLAIAPDGTLYASDPNWDDGTGQLWRIDPDGTTTRLAADMGTTNGIDISPDGTTLYVNESVQRNVWAFTITPQRTLTDKRLIRRFSDHGFDGMRCDVDGNLYITRYGAGTVVKMTPDGVILKTIALPGRRPSNLCFGGSDGRTVYVTLVDSAQVVCFRTDRPGRSWAEQQTR